MLKTEKTIATIKLTLNINFFINLRTSFIAYTILLKPIKSIKFEYSDGEGKSSVIKMSMRIF